MEDISFEIQAGEFISILGPSGSGKSTILKCIAGLERPERGTVRLAGKTLSNVESAGDGQTVAVSSRSGKQRAVWVPPEKRGISVIFQSLALWPHMTVFENVAYPLISARVPQREIGERVHRLLSLVGCEMYARSYPTQLSGGEQQRVACARALVGNPELVLFDEPFSSLDADLRANLRRWLLDLRDETEMTGLFVTHDQEEALMVGDRVAVVGEGNLISLSSPEDLYNRPTTSRVAKALGAMNIWAGKVISSGPEGAAVELDPARIRIAGVNGSAPREGSEVLVGCRPGKIGLRAGSDPIGENEVAGTVVFARFLGEASYYEVACRNTIVQATSLDPYIAVGDEVVIHLPPSDLILFTDRP